MSYEHTPGGDTSPGGNWLSEVGTYHFVIVKADENPTKNNGTLINNAAFSVAISVLDGTTPGQRDKPVNLVFFHPKQDGTENGKKLAIKKMDCFFLAVAIMTKAEIEEKKKVKFDLQDCVGRQFVAKFEVNKKSDKEQLQLSWANIFHVDDPAVKDVPKSEDALKTIDAELRWPGGKPVVKETIRKTYAKEENDSPAVPKQENEFSDL